MPPGVLNKVIYVGLLGSDLSYEVNHNLSIQMLKMEKEKKKILI